MGNKNDLDLDNDHDHDHDLGLDLGSMTYYEAPACWIFSLHFGEALYECQ